MPNGLLQGLKGWIVGLPYSLLGILAIFMALAPFQPEPHLVQKFQWLIQGLSFKPIDVFDVLWHMLPVLLMALKWYLSPKAISD
ncbi:hypothetical protein NBRC116188_08680 [Oceaniserpentilla sp. 4NH20-0058]|uniref:hypothetical protein n=1 Tax=Oceaniserpentilla sp. 4NH20-0058 TaxID=3127660 RepID=UPI003107C66F